MLVLNVYLFFMAKILWVNILETKQGKQYNRPTYVLWKYHSIKECLFKLSWVFSNQFKKTLINISMKSLSIKIVSLIWLFGLGIFVCIFYAETLKTHIFQVCAGRLTQAWTCINAHDKVRVIDGVEHYSMQRTYTLQKKIIVLCLINF